mgnify:CR=1 FL=1
MPFILFENLEYDTGIIAYELEEEIDNTSYSYIYYFVMEKIHSSETVQLTHINPYNITETYSSAFKELIIPIIQNQYIDNWITNN